MDQNNNHPHYVWALVAIVTIILIAWIYSSNRPDQSNYAKDSTHAEVHNNYYPLSAGFGGCMAIKPDGTLVKGHKNEKNPVVSTNGSH